MINVNRDFWRAKRVLVTGHTGFKGSWLSLWLQSMGAEVYGFALSPPTDPALFNEAQVEPGMTSIIGDIRDFATVDSTMRHTRPEIIFHLAAQPLVRYAYQAPVETYSTNVMGAVHLFEAARQLGTVRAIVNVTSDKCYENREWIWGYRETDPVGGHDPYSSSKGCAELVTSAYRHSFFGQGMTALASARAGNVIGGGDWANDRLVPDILRAFERGQTVAIRSPRATRPWQHVLDPLSGYLILAEKLYTEGQAWADGWNFGPHDGDAREVQWIVEYLAKVWGNAAVWSADKLTHPHEAQCLNLDITKAKTSLHWAPRWDLATALNLVLEWHRAWLAKEDMRSICMAQIHQHQALA